MENNKKIKKSDLKKVDQLMKRDSIKIAPIKKTVKLGNKKSQNYAQIHLQSFMVSAEDQIKKVQSRLKRKLDEKEKENLNKLLQYQEEHIKKLKQTLNFE